jgi:starch synthase (maltosyl-transferring)
MPGKEEYVNNEKYEIRHWNWEQTNKVTEVISLVNRIRREHPALQCNGNLAVGETTDPYLFLFTRLSPLNDELMIVVINFDSFNNRQGMVKLPQQVCSLIDADNYQVKDLLSGDVYWWNKTENYVALNPDDLPAHILILPLPLKQDQ